ncbi:hypothetical protein [Mycolicibacterium nivoides]|uniref:PPE family protein n=1 Tax=Mycolicibacterium nivoides TaxID=2487344 RepID=A0ABW9L8Y1_9MYCO
MWSTTAPELIDKPGWTTDPTLPTAFSTQEWAVSFSRKFVLGAAPQIGMAASPRFGASLGLVANPEIGMVAAPRYSAQFGLEVTPQIGMAFPPPIPADFNLGISPSVGMTAAEHYARTFELAATPGLGFAAAERYARSFGLIASPQVGFGAQQRFSGAFSLATAPTLGFTAAIAPVRFDNASNGGAGGTTTRSWSHNNQGNCIVVLFTNSTTTASTCTYGGVNIPRVYGPVNSGTIFPANGYCSVFALISDSLPTGVNTVSCTQAGAASAAGAVTMKNAGSFGTIITDNASGAINKTTVAGDGRAAVAGYGGGGLNFGTMSPNQVLNNGFTAFVTWPTVMGWGLDTGAGIAFAATQSSSKAGAIVPILPAT